MADLYPLLLAPQFHERVWGTRDLAPLYSREIMGAPIGEAWLTGDDCTVSNGPFSGTTLSYIARDFREQLTGEAAPVPGRFPLLLKFLFPRDRLSVQVHPDDVMAGRMGLPCGKTECWYILRAAPGSQIGLGLKPGTSKDEVKRAIDETRMEQLLNWVPVHEGDMFYVDAGTVHAIGPGAVILETQQNSDTTFRLYDYGRPRELHVQDGLAALKERTHAGRVLPGEHHQQSGKEQANLVSSPCFIVDKFRLSRAWEFKRPKHARRSAWCVVATHGFGVMECAWSPPLPFSAGEAIVVPANVDKFVLSPHWDLEFLCASLPTEKVAAPKTVLWEDQRTAADAPRPAGAAL